MVGAGADGCPRAVPADEPAPVEDAQPVLNGALGHPGEADKLGLVVSTWCSPSRASRRPSDPQGGRPPCFETVSEGLDVSILGA